MACPEMLKNLGFWQKRAGFSSKTWKNSLVSSKKNFLSYFDCLKHLRRQRSRRNLLMHSLHSLQATQKTNVSISVVLVTNAGLSVWTSAAPPQTHAASVERLPQAVVVTATLPEASPTPPQ